MTRRTRTSNRLRGDHDAYVQRRVTNRTIADLAFRLTGRDKQLLDELWRVRVLTTHQITALMFPSESKARHRLLELYRLNVITRFRPWVPVGTAPYHWVLGPAGAPVLAQHLGLASTKDLKYRHDAAIDLAHSQKLGHHVGVNEFYVGLIRHSRKRADGCRLRSWLSEKDMSDPRFTESTDDDFNITRWSYQATADAYGHWQEPPGPDGQGSSMDFYLEHDMGTVTLHRVAAKIGRYREFFYDHQDQPRREVVPVLFWLPTAGRENNLRRLLLHVPPDIPVATAVQTTYLEGPGAALWRPVRPGIAPQLTWRELTTTYEQWKPAPPKPTKPPQNGYYQ